MNFWATAEMIGHTEELAVCEIEFSIQMLIFVIDITRV